MPPCKVHQYAGWKYVSHLLFEFPACVHDTPHPIEAVLGKARFNFPHLAFNLFQHHASVADIGLLLAQNAVRLTRYPV